MVTAPALLLAVLVATPPQQQAKGLSPQRSRALDGAAMTPYMTKRGAESVKNVAAGADLRKGEEDRALTAPAATAPSAQEPAKQEQTQKEPIKAPAAPSAPKVEDALEFRLVGISSGKHAGLAQFEVAGSPVVVGVGGRLLKEIKVLRVTRNHVVLEIKGERMQLTPW